MFSNALILLTMMFTVFASSDAFWWTSSSPRAADNENIEPANGKQIPLGYLRFYTYHPVLPVAAARSFIPYQGVQKYVDEPVNWAARPVSADIKAQPSVVPVAKAHLFVPPPALIHQNQNTKQTQPAPVVVNKAVVEETTVAKIMPSPTTTTTAAPTPLASAPSDSALVNNEIPIHRIATSEQQSSPPSPSSYAVRDSPINSFAPPVHVSLPQYSQPLPDAMHSPYLPTYQNPHVQYMPCMCPVSVGVASDLLPHKAFESREDTFDVNLADDFE